MIRRPPRPPIKMMQPIALDLANSVTLLPYPDVETDNDVVIPESPIHLNENQQSHLEQTIDPLLDDNNEGIDLYQQTVNALTNLL